MIYLKNKTQQMINTNKWSWHVSMKQEFKNNLKMIND